MNEHARQNAADDPREFWEQLYAGAAPIWSGRVNRTLADAVADLPPGRSLDLGCGEGGDVLWLAERGWHATGIDLSDTAVQRARKAARAWLDAAEGSFDGAHSESDDRAVERAADGSADGAAFGSAVKFADKLVDSGAADGTDNGSVDGVFGGADGSCRVGSGVATFVVADLADWVNSGREGAGNPEAFDLITASFLQSPVEMPRERILRAALERLASGGRLVLISHAAPPPWANDGAAGPGHVQKHGSGSESRDQCPGGPGGGGGQVGPVGAVGPDSPDGPVGPDGFDGPDGPVGPDGPDSPVGPVGAAPRHGAGAGDRHGAGAAPRHGAGSSHRHGAGSGGPKFFSPDEELETLGLSRFDVLTVDREGTAGDTAAPPTPPAGEYTVIAAEIRKREVTDPEGKPALIDDSLVIVRRAHTAQ